MSKIPLINVDFRKTRQVDLKMDDIFRTVTDDITKFDFSLYDLKLSPNKKIILKFDCRVFPDFKTIDIHNKIVLYKLYDGSNDDSNFDLSG